MQATFAGRVLWREHKAFQTQTTPRKKWRTQLQPVVDSEEDLVLAAVPVVAAEDADGAVVVDADAVVAARKTPRSGFQ